VLSELSAYSAVPDLLAGFKVCGQGQGKGKGEKTADGGGRGRGEGTGSEEGREGRGEKTEEMGTREISPHGHF